SRGSPRRTEVGPTSPVVLVPPRRQAAGTITTKTGGAGRDVLVQITLSLLDPIPIGEACAVIPTGLQRAVELDPMARFARVAVGGDDSAIGEGHGRFQLGPTVAVRAAPIR